MDKGKTSHYQTLGKRLAGLLRRHSATETVSVAAMQGMVADLTAYEPDITGPLKELVSRQAFIELLPLAGSGRGKLQCHALLQDLSRIYNDQTLGALRLIVSGYLALADKPSSDVPQQTALESVAKTGPGPLDSEDLESKPNRFASLDPSLGNHHPEFVSKNQRLVDPVSVVTTTTNTSSQTDSSSLGLNPDNPATQANQRGTGALVIGGTTVILALILYSGYISGYAYKRTASENADIGAPQTCADWDARLTEQAKAIPEWTDKRGEKAGWGKPISSWDYVFRQLTYNSGSINSPLPQGYTRAQQEFIDNVKRFSSECG